MFYNGKIAQADKGIDRRKEKGPFDIIGDVHGCFDELKALLEKLGYDIDLNPEDNEYGISVKTPGRKVIFAGDLVDRGPKSPEVLKLAMAMVKAGQALCIPGNHDEKLMRKLMGRPVQINHGLEKTVKQMESESGRFKKAVKEFLLTIPSYYILDEGKLVIAHAGLKEDLQGEASREVREFCLYGESTGEHDEHGLPIRVNWAAHYQGEALVVYGHTPVNDAYWLNNTVDIDTGCVFGGKLTALRYPEMEVVSVQAFKEYVKSGRPFGFSF